MGSGSGTIEPTKTEGITTGSGTISKWEEVEGWKGLPDDVRTNLINKEKSFEAGFTKKFTDLSTERKTFESEKTNFGAVQTELEKSLEANNEWQKWYDNEYAYSCRLAEFAEFVGKKI